MKKKLFLLPAFLLTFALAACQQGGGNEDQKEDEQGETGGNEGSGSETTKLTVNLNQKSAEVEINKSVSILDLNSSEGVTYTHSETGTGEVTVRETSNGAWMLTGSKAGTVNFKVTAKKGNETAEATCVVTVKEAQSGESGEGESADPTVPTTGYAVTIGTQVIVLQADPAAQNEGAFANRKQGYLNKVSNVKAGEAIKFYSDGQEYSYVDAAGDNTAAQPPVYNNFAHGSEGGFVIQADVAAENNFYVNLWNQNEKGEEWFTFFLEGGTSADHGTNSSQEGGSGGQGEQTGQTGFGIKIGETPVLAEKLEEKDAQGREQYKITAQSFTAGQTFALYDASTGGTWVINIDSYSFSPSVPATDDAARVATYVTKGEEVYTVVQDFKADIYLKLKYQDDQIYFQLVNE